MTLRQGSLVLVVFLTLLSIAVLAAEEKKGVPPHVLYHEAHSHYQAGNYQKSISTYLDLINETGIKNSELYYNLGNSYFKEGRLGEAIFYFKNANRLSPRDADTLFNLQYARSKTLDKIEESTGLLDKMSGIFSTFSLKQNYLFLTASAVAVLIVSVLMIFYRKLDFLRWLQGAGLLLFLFFSICVVRMEFFQQPFGVVTEESKVYSAPGTGNIVLFSLHVGAEFDVFQSLPSQSLEIASSPLPWIRLRLADGKQGWIPGQKALSNTQ